MFAVKEETITEKEDEVKIPNYKRINKLLDGEDFGWKIPSKKIIKRKVHSDAILSTDSNNWNNRFLELEEDEEDSAGEYEEFYKKHVATDEVIQDCSIKLNNKFEVEN